MSITSEESELLGKRETELTVQERDVVGSTICELEVMMETYGLKPASDDRAGRLEAALIRYILESRE